jgi:glycosyltransferase involved in cell wall biosynthesis
MKLAYLMTQSLDSPSGLGRYGPMARSLARRGHEVEVYALHPDIAALTDRDFEDQGVKVHYVAPMHVKKSGNTKSYYPNWKFVGLAVYATFRLATKAANSSAEIVHICKPHPLNGLAGMVIACLKHKRVFVDCDDYESGSSRFTGRWQKSMVSYFEKHIPLQAEMVTTNTHFMRGLLASWGVKPDRLLYLPNGVEPTRFMRPNELRLQGLRRELKIVGRPVISFVGSLSLPSHPVDLLIQAFAILARRMPEPILLIVGGGEDFEYLRNMVEELDLEERVRFAGRVLPEEVVDYYAISDISIDPVHDDDAARGRSPLKLFESWACGTPFVTADVGDRRTLAGDPPAAGLVRPGDPLELADTLANLLSNPQERETLRRRGLESVQNYYWDRLILDLERSYGV